MKKIILISALLITTVNCAQINKASKASSAREELLIVKLPEKHNWKITNEGYDDNKFILLLEEFTDATEKESSAYLAITSTLDRTNVDLQKEMKHFFKTTKVKSVQAKLTVIEHDKKVVEPYIIFLVETMYNNERKQKESFVCMYKQGKKSFHTCTISMEESAFTKEEIVEKVRLLKTCQIVFK